MYLLLSSFFPRSNHFSYSLSKRNEILKSIGMENRTCFNYQIKYSPIQWSLQINIYLIFMNLIWKIPYSQFGGLHWTSQFIYIWNRYLNFERKKNVNSTKNSSNFKISSAKNVRYTFFRYNNHNFRISLIVHFSDFSNLFHPLLSGSLSGNICFHKYIIAKFLYDINTESRKILLVSLHQ